MFGEIFYWVFNMSIASTICMVPVLLLRFVKKIPRNLFVWLWAVPFVRFCIPIGISSEYGLMALLSRFMTKTVIIFETGDGSDLTMMNFIMGAKSYSPISYKVDVLKDIFLLAFGIWSVVALALILALVIIYSTTIKETKDSKHLRDNIYVSDKIKTPAVYGIIKPRIILPLEYKTSECDYVLMHENAHIKRKDNFIRLFAFVVVCIHWFNPFAWLILKLLFSDIELACDETVLAKCDEKQRKEYGNALITTAEKTNIFTSSFSGTKIRTRIENILSYKKLSVFSATAFFLLIMVIFYVLLTNA